MKFEQIECKICNKKLSKNGSYLHFRTHKLTTKEYNEKFNIIYEKKTKHKVIEDKKCPYCDSIFKSNGINSKPGTALAIHIESKHKDKINEYFHKKEELILDKNNRWQCQICKQKFRDSRNFGYHLRRIHNIEPKDYLVKYFGKSKCVGLFEECFNETKYSFDKNDDYCKDCLSKSKHGTQIGYWKRIKGINSIDEAIKLQKQFIGNTFKSENGNNTSKISQELFKELEKYLQEYNIYYAFKNKEFNLWDNKNKKYWFYDFVITSNINLCIEFNGDMWHGNPIKYKEDDYPNPFRKTITAKQIWNEDQYKAKFLKEQRNIDTIIIWESEYKNNKQNVIDNILSIINERILNESCKS